MNSMSTEPIDLQVVVVPFERRAQTGVGIFTIGFIERFPQRCDGFQLLHDSPFEARELRRVHLKFEAQGVGFTDTMVDKQIDERELSRGTRDGFQSYLDRLSDL